MNKKYFILSGLTILIASVFIIRSRKTIPGGVEAVKNVEKEKYLGKWYEIARFDYFFEKNLNNTSAEYSLNSDQTIKVVNRGYNYKSKKSKIAIGKARFVDSDKEGKLKVSFFEPFYSGYNVVAIDSNYSNALVAGKNFKYLWFLSREKSMPQDIKEKYLQIAGSIGYDTSKLIWVEQNR